MISISLCMIVKNEEEVLQQCLDSVNKVCDEIIIVDTGSTDKTKEIAGKYTNKIHDFQWVDDFSAARNYSFSLATKEYILWLDADDILLKEDSEKLWALKNFLDPSIDSVTMNYILSFDEYNKPSFYFRRNRLVKRGRYFKWRGAVHEYLEVGGQIIDADISVVHRKGDKKSTPNNRNLTIYENRLKAGDEFSPRDLFYYANELKDHKRYNNAIEFYNQFLDTKRGWIEDRIRAQLYLADIYRVLKQDNDEMQSLLNTFTFDSPRSEACCRLGDLFQKTGHNTIAVYWYHCAIDHPQTNSLAFYNKAFSTWYPHLSLCKCYWKLGNIEKAIEHNNFVGKIRPKDPSFIYNQKFFHQYMNDHKAQGGK